MARPLETKESIERTVEQFNQGVDKVLNPAFPRKPLFDRVIVREIPIAEYYEQPEGFSVDLDNAHIKERTDRGVVVAIGTTPMPVNVGDTVFFDEFSLCDPVYLNPAHRNRSDLPKYWQMRVQDLKGVEVSNRVALKMQDSGFATTEAEKAVMQQLYTSGLTRA